MQDMNLVFLIGRLTKDAELKYTSQGLAVCNFTVANNQNIKKSGERENMASFFDCVLFGKMAENLKPYLQKGKQIALDGQLRQEKWQDSNGNNRYSYKIYANNVQLIGGATEAKSTFEKKENFQNSKSAENDRFDVF